MHPVETILQTTMRELKNIVDVNTIVGSPIYGEGGAVVIPVSKVCLGFFAGGGDFPTQAVAKKGAPDFDANGYPFLGASVVGVSISPKAFLYMQGKEVTLLHADCDNTLDRLVQMIPTALTEIRDAIENVRAQRQSPPEDEP
ncbi:MAG: GerW family sporulation protein [Clostridia bacterium]|jgi:sporulation protein YtfJ|nr:GerW family sporulation protein [Clostridia bacterium]